MTTRPVTLREAAERIGHDPRWLRAHLAELIERDKFPAPLCSIGRKKFDRRSFEAWMARAHPLAPRMPSPANDDTAALASDDVAAVRRRMQEIYGGST